MHVSSLAASPSLHFPHTALTVRFQFDLWAVSHAGNYDYHLLQHYCLCSSHTAFLCFSYNYDSCYFCIQPSIVGIYNAAELCSL